MATPIDRDDSQQPTVQTGVWIDEHDWLHRIFKSAENRSPKFRLPDLLSACVSLAIGCKQEQRRLVEYLETRLTLRDPGTERRSCDIWCTQFEQLMQAHRAAWNRFPNPMFEIDHITTACVAIAMQRPDGPAQVLQQARQNLLERAQARRATAN